MIKKNNTHTKAPIGVLALQGDFKEHIAVLEKCGAISREVRLPSDLVGLDGLIIPGGESTTIGKLMKLYGLDKAIVSHHKSGMAIYGTCAGAILLAKDIVDSKQPRLGLLDISIKRNEYGRQIDSFETPLKARGIGNMNGVFIRAPIIHSVSKNVEILSEFNGRAVMVRQGKIVASTFHPELSKTDSVHKYFIHLIEDGKKQI